MLVASMAGWLLLAAALILAAELGYRLHAWVRSRKRDDPSDEDEGSGYVLSAALGLLGLLIAFVFSMAAAHHEERRELVQVEADAISGAVQHFELLPQPYRGLLIRRMGDYVKIREEFFELGADFDAVDASMARAEALQDEIWVDASEALRQPESQFLTVPVLGAMNDMFDAASKRHSALNLRVPPRAIQVLIIYAVVTAAIMGHSLAPGRRRHRISSAGLFVLIAMAISLVIDLDSARIGSVHEPQAPMERVIAQVLEKAARATPPSTSP